MKHLERLKKMVACAVKNEWLDKNAFTGFQLKFKRKDRGYFTDLELSALENQALEICGIRKNLTFHLARHTFATLLLINGVPIETIKKILGHTKITTTKIYAHVHHPFG